MDKQGGICEDDVQGPKGPRDTKGGSIRGSLGVGVLANPGGAFSPGSPPEFPYKTKAEG